MLIESDKRGKENSIKLAYSDQDAEKFFVPANVYLLGTMNTADKSLAIMDYALNRRFAFITLESEYGHVFRTFLQDQGHSLALIEHICRVVGHINEKIRADDSLGDDFLIGHSYFTNYKHDQTEETWWQSVVNFEIKPFLNEIWFDKTNIADDLAESLAFNA
jgi:5-methylcytosine-specific restriction protein B